MDIFIPSLFFRQIFMNSYEEEEKGIYYEREFL